MADSSSGSNTSKPADRRSFLKIGAGVVVGAVVAGAGVAAYESSVIGSNNSSSSSTVASLSSQLSDTQNSLNSATAQISSLTDQLTSTQSSLSGAQSQLASASSTNASLSSQLNSATAQVATLQGQVSSATSQVSSLQSSLSTLQDNLDTETAFLSLSTTEQVELTAICNAIIPTDSTGPGATTAGAVYFIDRQLKNVYGTSGLVYRKDPYIPTNVTSAFSIDGVNYPGGSVTYHNGSQTYNITYNPTMNPRVGAGSRYQYPFDMKQFWTIGLAGIQLYANAAYGGNFETLSAANQTACLTDLWNNKPTYDGSNGALTGAPSSYQEVTGNINGYNSGVPGGSQFGSVLPSDFAYELFFMVWNGFWVDPVYGGNKGMVGWDYVGFHGVNLGNFYGEGYTSKQLMVLTTPLKLQPASLGQYQKGSP